MAPGLNLTILAAFAVYADLSGAWGRVKSSVSQLMIGGDPQNIINRNLATQNVGRDPHLLRNTGVESRA